MAVETVGVRNGAPENALFCTHEPPLPPSLRLEGSVDGLVRPRAWSSRTALRSEASHGRPFAPPDDALGHGCGDGALGLTR
jgi:hypothetical protein